MSGNLWLCMNQREATAELLRACLWEEAGHKGGAAYKAVYYLFQELKEHITDAEARSILLHFGKGVTARAIQHRKAQWTLQRLDDMAGGPNVGKLSREIAAENDEYNKSPLRNGAAQRPTNAASIEKYIIRLNKARAKRRAAVQARREADAGISTKKKTGSKPTRPARARASKA